MIDVTTRGLVADGVTDNSSALNAILTSLTARGGVLFFPAGDYIFNTTITINKSSVSFVGEGAYGATSLFYNGTGTSNFIDIQSCNYTKFTDLTIRTVNPTWAGFLTTIRNSGPGDPSGTTFTNVNFGPYTNSFGLNTNTSLNTTLNNCRFSGGRVGILGRTPTGYANVLQMNGGQFAGQSSGPIYVGGISWEFNNVTFEARSDGKGVAYTGDSSTPAYGVSFNDCWFGDATSADGAHSWITYAGYGLNVRGGFMSGTTGGNTGISLLGVKGFNITGVVFDQLSSAIDYSTATCKGGLVSGNSYTAVTNFETNTGNKDSSVINTGNASF